MYKTGASDGLSLLSFRGSCCRPPGALMMSSGFPVCRGSSCIKKETRIVNKTRRCLPRITASNGSCCRKERWINRLRWLSYDSFSVLKFGLGSGYYSLVARPSSVEAFLTHSTHSRHNDNNINNNKYSSKQQQKLQHNVNLSLTHPP